MKLRVRLEYFAYPELRLRLTATASLRSRLRSGLWPQTKILQKFLEKEKGPPFTFSWFQSCCGWRLRLTANRKLAVAVAVAVAVGIFDRNSGYEKNALWGVMQKGAWETSNRFKKFLEIHYTHIKHSMDFPRSRKYNAHQIKDEISSLFPWKSVKNRFSSILVVKKF